MPNAKSIGWAIYAAGFAIWLFGYLSAGHAPAFDWVATTPWWISSFVPNLEAELGLALMFASMIPIYVTLRGRPGPKYDVRPSAGECEPHKRINQKEDPSDFEHKQDPNHHSGHYALEAFRHETAHDVV